MGLLARHRRSWSVIVGALLCVPLLAQLVQAPETVSQREARVLAQWPSTPHSAADLSAWPRAVDRYLGEIGRAHV